MPNSADPYLAERQRMVDEQIRRRGIGDPRVLRVMELTPRERFVAPQASGQAFADQALPIECRQTISQPYMVAAMTTLLRVQPHHRVLEIGTGSGYQTAVLAQLCQTVYTVERLPLLTETAHATLHELGIHNVVYRVGDGTLGWPEEAPFDRIIVTAGAPPEIPPALLEQLAEGGRLVIPVGGETDQILTAVDRVQGRFHEHPQFPCRFVKLIGRQGWQPDQTRADR
jgi:protein-L-isoaspartate(D-aspartate) O-methyltransferase